MRIAIIGTSYPFKGGLAAYNERLARQLQSEGHDVTIYTFTVQYPEFLYPGKSQYSTDPAPRDLSIVACINSVSPYSWYRAAKKISKSSPDILIISFWLPLMGPGFGTILKQVRKNSQTRLIAIIHNIIPHESRPGDRIFSKYFVKQVDGFLVMSKSVMDDLGAFDHVKPRVYSPHPLYDHYGQVEPKANAASALGLPENQDYLLFFGLIREYKGLDLLIEALAFDEVSKLGLKLIVAGEFYASKRKYMDLIESLDLGDSIILVDKFIPEAEVAHYFNISDVVVQPYKSATQSGVTQIAYHFDKPMIVTNVGGLAEMCPDGKVGYVVEPDAPSIASAITRFFEQADRETMIEHIRREKQRYSWSILTENIMTLAQEIEPRVVN